jgi:hypothetical protein
MQLNAWPAVAGRSREDTGDMGSERAETYLRLLAEAELRRATTMDARSSPGRWHSARLALAAQALSAVGAVGADVADQIQADVGLVVAGRHRLPAPGPGPDRIRLTSQRASWRVVPVGQVIEIRDGDLCRELVVIAYVQCADGARFIVAGWPFRPFTAMDDQGVSYYLDWHRGPAVTLLPLRPDPPHQIRWLDLTTAAGEPATRIDLDRQMPVPDVTVTPTAHSPGELLLDVIASRILSLVVPFSHDNPRQMMPANADLRAFVGDGPGQIVAVLCGAGVLPPDSPAPGQLAGLCARLGLDGHGITAPPAVDLPERWQSMLTPSRRREPWAQPAPGMLAAAELPELDGAQITIMGLHHGERGTIMHLLVSGVTLEDDWKFARGVMPLPVLWIRDSNGRWHATGLAGRSPWGTAGVVVLSMRIVPPLDRGTTWIELSAAGQSAQVRATLLLSSR